MTERQRIIRQEKQKRYLEIIQVFCGENDLEYEVLQPTQFRVKGRKTVDFYPNSDKIFIVGEGWGLLSRGYDIIDALNTHCKPLNEANKNGTGN